MHLSRIRIENFRNFSELDVSLSGNVVILGENRVGKSNLLYALRLIFDSDLPDSARQLGFSDFWDGIEEVSAEHRILISVEIKDFESDPDVLAVLTDYRLDDDPQTVRLSYEFRPASDLDGAPATSEDFEFVCYGGESDTKRFAHNLRRRISMDVLPALRDAETDLAIWKRSPLRPLLDKAFAGIDPDELNEVAEAIETTSEQLTEFEAVQNLEQSIADLFREFSGPKQDIKPKLGFSPTDPQRLYRSVRLLIDEGARGISDASLGSANLVFLSLKTLEIRHQIEENRRDHTFLAIEEPEAHLHPHLQRSVYENIFLSSDDEGEQGPLSVILTTHSPHIASVAPFRSILLLRDTSDNGTKGYSTSTAPLSSNEAEDISRYLDVTRAEMLFARGVVLVEGDAEKFLVPAFSKKMGLSLDQLGISICSVSGTNFNPYVKFLMSLGIPCSIITDWDPRDEGKPLGYNRCLNLVREIERQRTGSDPDALITELKALDDFNEFGARCEEFGVYSNVHTLEIDLFEQGFSSAIISALRDFPFSAARKLAITSWEENNASLDKELYLKMIETVGKGRFAQRLTSYLGETAPPEYIAGAIQFVVDRV